MKKKTNTKIQKKQNKKKNIQNIKLNKKWKKNLNKPQNCGFHFIGNNVMRAVNTSYKCLISATCQFVYFMAEQQPISTL